MMGPRQVARGALVQEVSIGDHVPSDHLSRAMDRCADLGDMRRHLAPVYGTTGRPSVDAELMIRMLILGDAVGIRSERRLCEQVHLNLAHRRVCRLDPSDPVPDHSTVSRNRHGRFRDSDRFRHLFESVVARCIVDGLAGGQTFASDASLIGADADKRFAAAGADWDPAPRAVRACLEVLDDAAFGAASEAEPKLTSFADPASQWTGARKGPAFFAYSDTYLIDTDRGVILDVESTGSIRTAEVGATRKMIARRRERSGRTPERLAADTAYGSGEMLGRRVGEGIAPHIPVIARPERRDGTFSNPEVRHDPDKDADTCPGGKALKNSWRQMTTPRDGVGKDGFRKHVARKQGCSACALKALCTPNPPTRKISRHVHEAARDAARRIVTTDLCADASRRRKKVERLFAHLKRILRRDRLRLRGPNGAGDGFLPAATARNLRTLAKPIPGAPAMA